MIAITRKSISLYVPQTRFTYSVLIGINVEKGGWLIFGRGFMIDTKDPHLSITSIVPFRRDGGARWFNINIGREFA